MFQVHAKNTAFSHVGNVEQNIITGVIAIIANLLTHTTAETEDGKVILNMSKAKKEGREACLAGMPFNKCPYAGKKGVIANLQRCAWEREFLETERNVKGV